MVGNQSITGTLKEIAAQTGTTAGGVNQRIEASTKQALDILQSRGIIEITSSGKASKRVYTIRKSQGLKEIENHKDIQERQIDTGENKILSLF